MVYIPTMHIKTPLDFQREYETLLASQQARQVQQQQMQLAQMKQEAFMREQQQAQEQQRQLADAYSQWQQQQDAYNAAMKMQSAAPALQEMMKLNQQMVPQAPPPVAMPEIPKPPEDVANVLSDKLMAMGRFTEALAMRKDATPGGRMEKMFDMFPAKVQEAILRNPETAKRFFPEVSWGDVYKDAGPDVSNLSGKMRDYIAIHGAPPTSMEQLYPRRRTTINVPRPDKVPAAIQLDKYKMEQYKGIWKEDPTSSPEAWKRYQERTRETTQKIEEYVDPNTGLVSQIVTDRISGTPVMIPVLDKDGNQVRKMTFKSKKDYAFQKKKEFEGLKNEAKIALMEYGDQLKTISGKAMKMFQYNLDIQKRAEQWKREDAQAAKVEAAQKAKEAKARAAAAAKAATTANKDAMKWADETRRELNAMPTVRSYKRLQVIIKEIRAAVNGYKKAKADPNIEAGPAGILLVNKFSRLADDNAVREGEYARVGAAQSLQNSIRTYLQTVTDGGVQLTPAGADEMMRMANNILGANKAHYANTVAGFKRIAQTRFPNNQEAMDVLLGLESGGGSMDSLLKQKGLK